MLSLGEILKYIREDLLDWTQDKLSEKLEIPRVTYSSDEREARPNRKHGSLEFYEKYKKVIGIDLYRSITEGHIIIIDPTKIPWNKIVQLVKEKNARICFIPVYDVPLSAGGIPLYQDEQPVAPAFLLPVEMYQGAAFGIRVDGNSMEPEINIGDYIICSGPLSVENVSTGHIYLIATDDEHQTVQSVQVDKKQRQLLLKSPNPDRAPQLMPLDKVKRIYKVIGHHRNERNINKSR
jgi:SOS-response transcriptional repressor LexA